MRDIKSFFFFFQAEDGIRDYIGDWSSDVCSSDLAESVSALRRWTDHVQKWRAWAAERGMDVEFEYIGESELLAALALPANAGRAYYWFNTRDRKSVV